MNNIDKLIEIIEKLGGSATIDEICERFEENNGIVLSINHTATINNTLLENCGKLIRYDDAKRKFFVNNNNKISKVNTENNFVTHSDIKLHNQILTIGNWTLRYKKDSNMTIVGKNDRSVDIEMPKNGIYQVSSENMLPSCSLYGMSSGLIQKRPYIYRINRNEIKKVFNDIDNKLLNMLDEGLAIFKNGKANITKVEGILLIAKELNEKKYDGSYTWMLEAIKEYSKIKDFSKVDVNDMNFIYSLAVGTWKMSTDVKKDRLNKSNLSKESKEHLRKIIDEVFNNATKDLYYCHSGNTYSLNYPSSVVPHVGMFGTGFMTFSGKLSDDDARKFIKMCVDILNIKNDNSIYDICDKTINNNYEARGLKSASASAILHCYKPQVFPILNGNDGHGTIFEELGIELNDPTKLKTYIDNCRQIKKYRDANYGFKNYRLMDVAMWAVDQDDFDLREYFKSIKVL